MIDCPLVEGTHNSKVSFTFCLGGILVYGCGKIFNYTVKLAGNEKYTTVQYATVVVHTLECTRYNRIHEVNTTVMPA